MLDTSQDDYPMIDVDPEPLAKRAKTNKALAAPTIPAVREKRHQWSTCYKALGYHFHLYLMPHVEYVRF